MGVKCKFKKKKKVKRKEKKECNDWQRMHKYMFIRKFEMNNIYENMLLEYY